MELGPPLSVETYMLSVRPAVIVLMISSAFTVVLIPLFTAMMTLSTPYTRSRPMFICAALNTCLGFGVGVWTMYLEARVLLDTFWQPSRKIIFSWIGVYCTIPWFVDLTLLLRILAVYPPLTTPRKKRIAVLAFPILIKAVRLSLLIVGKVLWYSEFMRAPDPWVSADRELHVVWIKVEWTLQMADNGYATLIFLSKIRKNSGQSLHTSNSSNSLAKRMRTLSWIAATNFIVPLIFDIVQLTVVLSSNAFLLSGYIRVANTFVGIIGVVFATVWANSTYNRAICHQGSLRGTGIDPAEVSLDPISFSSPLRTNLSTVDSKVTPRAAYNNDFTEAIYDITAHVDSKPRSDVASYNVTVSASAGWDDDSMPANKSHSS